MENNCKKTRCRQTSGLTALAIATLLLSSGGTMAAWAANSRHDVAIQQQDGRIIVTVTDTKGEPIIGANVLEKGTTNGGITDLDGKVTLNARPGTIIQISYIGYQTVEMAATPNMRVQLKDDSELLDEVVVVGYGTQKKVNLTGAVSSVDVTTSRASPC